MALYWDQPWWIWIVGWMMTAFAATMGAPFWFDLLNKMMVIRSTVKPKEKSPEEGSEDRQISKDRGGKGHDGTAAPAGGSSPPASPSSLPPGSPPMLAPIGIPTAGRDLENDQDACDVNMATNPTPDEGLPPAAGGVAGDLPAGLPQKGTV